MNAPQDSWLYSTALPLLLIGTSNLRELTLIQPIIGKKIESRARDMGQSNGRDKQRLEAIEWYEILLCSYATLVTPTGTEITAQVVFRNIARRRDIGELSALMTQGLLNVERNQTHG